MIVLQISDILFGRCGVLKADIYATTAKARSPTVFLTQYGHQTVCHCPPLSTGVQSPHVFLYRKSFVRYIYPLSTMPLCWRAVRSQISPYYVLDRGVCLIQSGQTLVS